jgi:hypothetical protein
VIAGAGESDLEFPRLDFGIAATPYPLHQYLECRTMSGWHALAASSLQDFRNRRQAIVFEPADYAPYRDLLAERCRRASVEVWAYCLMPNHVHLVLTPSTPKGLARAIGET